MRYDYKKHKEQAIDASGLSRTTPRTVDGLRVAVAGLAPETPVEFGPDVEIQAVTVGELRALAKLPHRVEVLIPYRSLPGNIVRINRS